AVCTPDGCEVWVTVRGENYVAVLDAHTYEEKARIVVPGGPGMQIFSPKRPVRVRLLLLHPGDGGDHGEGSPDRRPGPSGESVLPQHRSHSGRRAGLVHAEGCRQDHGI